MEFRLLGPVELWVAGRRVEVGPQQRRAVLAALLVDAGRPVSPQTLVDRVWDKAPASARRALHAHITRIRRLLKGTGTELVRHSGGYVLGVDPECVDLHRFHRLSPTEPRAALDLWHGAALADLTGSWAVRTRWNWQQQRVDTTVRWTVAEVRLGRPDRVIEAMRDLAEEHPLSEPVAEALIAAFVAAGRSAEALGQYEEIRVRLVEELGADPCARLQELHRSILHGEPVVGGSSTAVRNVPAQLPADLAVRPAVVSVSTRAHDWLVGSVTQKYQGPSVIRVRAACLPGMVNCARNPNARLRIVVGSRLVVRWSPGSLTAREDSSGRSFSIGCCTLRNGMNRTVSGRNRPCAE